MNATRQKVLDAIESCIERDFISVNAYAQRERLALAFLSGYLERDEPEIASALEKLRKVTSDGI